MSIASEFSRSAIALPEQTAIAFGEESVSYSRLQNQSNLFSTSLQKLAITKGDRVIQFTGSSIPLVCSVLGTLIHGSILIPVNTQFKEAELLHVLADSGAKAIVTDTLRLPLVWKVCAAHSLSIIIILLDGHAEGTVSFEEMIQGEVRHAADLVSDEDVAAIFYTSGTTGKPKGAALSHRNVTSNLAALRTAWQWSQQDVLLLTLPLYHVHGLGLGLLGSLLTGNKIVLKQKFDAAEVLQTIAEKHITMFMGVPTMYYKLVEVPDSGINLSGMRLFISGSAPLTTELFMRFKEKFGFEILERAGMSESMINFSNPFEGKRKPGSVGFPLPGVELRIVNEDFQDQPVNTPGEILLRGQNVFKGYWNKEEETRRSFHGEWFMTGDIGMVDEEGYVSIVGRKKDVIKSGGILIFPKEIEEVIERLPHVVECAVVGVPDPAFGESVKACVVTDGTPLNAEEIISHCKAQLASYKKPRYVSFYEALPKNVMGKILKETLRKDHTASQEK